MEDFFNINNPLLLDSMIALALYLAYRISLRKFPQVARIFNEVSMVFLVFFFYDAGRYLALNEEKTAIANARKVIHFEKVAGIGIEASLQRIFLTYAPLLVRFMNSFYLAAHWGSIFVFFGWAIWRSRANTARHDLYVTARARFVVMNALASIAFITFPCAPPRMIADGGYVDTLQSVSNTDVYTSTRRFVNPYAAMPSMHIGYSLLFSLSIIFFLRAELKPSARNCTSVSVYRRQSLVACAPFLMLLYPCFMVLVIIATGNHFVLDAIAGATTCAIAIVLQFLLARLWERVKAAKRAFDTKRKGGRYTHLNQLDGDDSDSEHYPDVDIEMGAPAAFDTSSPKGYISATISSPHA